MTTAKDGIGEFCSIDGLGNIFLGGALGGAKPFMSAYDNGVDQIPVKVELLDSNYAVIAWERVRCTYVTAGNQLVRGDVMESSNGGSLVNFGPGTKRAFVYLPVDDVSGSGSITAADITDSSATGREVLKGDAGVGRGVLEVYSEQETLIKINAKFAEVFPMLIPLQAIQAKISCKVATIGNIDINAPLSAIAGIDLFDNERALVWQQDDELENGTYFLIDGYLSRYGRFYTDDLPTFSTLEVQQGTYAGRRFRVTSETATPGTAPMTWELVGHDSLGLGSASVLDFAVSGDATAGQVVKGDDSRLGGGGGGGISIGDSIGGGTAQSVPFIDASGNLAQEPTFNYSTISNVLSAQIISASNIVGAYTVRGSVFLFADDQDTYFVRFGPQRVGIGGASNVNDAALEIGAVRKKPYTVGTLPIAPLMYDQCVVVDALAPAIGSAVIGGGGRAANVIWISPNWRVI